MSYSSFFNIFFGPTQEDPDTEFIRGVKTRLHACISSDTIHIVDEKNRNSIMQELAKIRDRGTPFIDAHWQELEKVFTEVFDIVTLQGIERDSDGFSFYHYIAECFQTIGIELTLRLNTKVKQSMRRGIFPKKSLAWYVAIPIGAGAAVTDSVKFFYEGAKKLLEDGANPNERDIFGRTPLMYVAVAGYFYGGNSYMPGRSKMTELLLNYGADPKARDNFGKSVLDYFEEFIVPDLEEDGPIHPSVKKIRRGAGVSVFSEIKVLHVEKILDQERQERIWKLREETNYRSSHGIPDKTKLS